MKTRELKEWLSTIPDNAEVAHKKYLNDKGIIDRIALVLSSESNLWQIYLKEYQGLPKGA